MKQHRYFDSGKVQKHRFVCTILLLVSFGLIVSGLISQRTQEGFGLEVLPTETSIPLDDSFDETLSVSEIELTMGTWYALQVGAFENRESALETARVFQNRGAAGYIWNEGRYRVLASVYPSMEEAQRVREQLKEQHAIDTYVYAIEMPALKLRINGMQGQIDVVQASFLHVSDLAVQLQQLTTEVDRQEKTVAEVQNAIEALETQLRIVAVRIKQRFAQPFPETLEILLDCFESFEEYAACVNEVQSVFEMGISLKKQTFEVLWNIKQIYHSLSTT